MRDSICVDLDYAPHEKMEDANLVNRVDEDGAAGFSPSPFYAGAWK